MIGCRSLTIKYFPKVASSEPTLPGFKKFPLGEKVFTLSRPEILLLFFLILERGDADDNDKECSLENRMRWKKEVQMVFIFSFCRIMCFFSAFIALFIKLVLFPPFLMRRIYYCVSC